VDWSEQEAEIEALEVIFPEEFKILQKRPYHFDIIINSNSDKELNHLKLLLKVELGVEYPNKIPFMLLKNLSPKFLDNRMID
jgi:hypothetical protein